MDEEETAQLIQPVAKVELSGAAPAASAAPRTGEQVVNSVCGACHNAGVAGAPKTGDNAAWAVRFKDGLDGMVKIAMEGKGAMPPKGGGADLTELEITRAVVFMANKSGGSFKEPAAPAPAGGESAPAEAPAKS
ncbi:c-type cytochrome [Uliginosibacterium sp. H1]|uniref:c-type cytochrome n=1 Tax=Uliginosibacterium sp. H1 TaxID=3114757 RepID=UPI002E18B8E2|nr:c-type cytochrome [Uliginosibacterium sp. H1]